jgi:hypothetical protein
MEGGGVEGGMMKDRARLVGVDGEEEGSKTV